MADEIGKLRAALARLERGRGKRYSAEMRERIRRVGLAMHDAGTGWHRIVLDSGLAWSRWVEYGWSTGAGWSVRPWRWLTLQAYVVPATWTSRAGAPGLPTPDSGAAQLTSDFAERQLFSLRVGGSAAVAW
jgi:hypothetical protein